MKCCLNITVFVFFTFYIMLTNGVHGAVRDLPNDLKAGMYATSAMLGGRSSDDGKFIIPTLLQGYTFVMHVLLTLVIAIPILFNWFNYPTTTWIVTALIVVGLLIAAFYELGHV